MSVEILGDNINNGSQVAVQNNYSLEQTMIPSEPVGVVNDVVLLHDSSLILKEICL